MMYAHNHGGSWSCQIPRRMPSLSTHHPLPPLRAKYSKRGSSQNLCAILQIDRLISNQARLGGLLSKAACWIEELEWISEPLQGRATSESSWRNDRRHSGTIRSIGRMHTHTHLNRLVGKEVGRWVVVHSLLLYSAFWRASLPSKADEGELERTRRFLLLFFFGTRRSLLARREFSN